MTLIRTISWHFAVPIRFYAFQVSPRHHIPLDFFSASGVARAFSYSSNPFPLAQSLFSLCVAL